MHMTDLPDAKAPPSLASEEQEKWELRRLIAAVRETWRIPSLAAVLVLILGFAGLGDRSVPVRCRISRFQAARK